ncbi:malic enzyme [Cladochytrium replicatum]|nr:malic enzyme [Cladochytrium replicatum]
MTATIIEDGLDDTTHHHYEGAGILHLPLVNQGSAFSNKIRAKMHLNGLVPAVHDTLETQADRAITLIRRFNDPIAKFMFLDRLKSEDSELFYRLVIDHLPELCPIIYTPTIGDVCLNFSLLYTPGFNRGLFLTLADQDRLDEVLANWPHPNVDISVMTDGSRILGLGDLGVNGMGIPMGKLDLYIAAGGFAPSRTLPIQLDLGTNTESIRDDKHYIGTCTKRPATDEEFYGFVDKVMAALRSRWPDILVQFEDFSTEHAFNTLTRYRNEYLMFNDDIQGTGAVILSGFINAVKLSNIPLDQHRLLFYGAGSAGVGVAQQIQEYFIRTLHLSEPETRRFFYLVDSKGLVTRDRGDRLPSHKQLFARDDNASQQFRTLHDIIAHVRPTALIGLSCQPGDFTPAILKQMSELHDRPIVFPLSNPMSKSECTFAGALEHTDGRVLFASGTGFPPARYGEEENVRVPGQGNNMYIFPGLGQGAATAKAKKVSDTMVYTAAVALAESLSEEEKRQGWLYPSLARIREISCRIATEVAVVAGEEGLARNEVCGMGREAVEKEVRRRMYVAGYPENDLDVEANVENYSKL